MRFDEIFREMEAFQRRIMRSAFEDLDRYSLFGDGRLLDRSLPADRGFLRSGLRLGCGRLFLLFRLEQPLLRGAARPAGRTLANDDELRAALAADLEDLPSDLLVRDGVARVAAVTGELHGTLAGAGRRNVARALALDNVSGRLPPPPPAPQLSRKYK